MKHFHPLFAALLCWLALQPAIVRATQTENNVLRILPAPGPVKIDGKADDWDLSGGIFACDDVERLRDLYSVWFFAMYDKQNLYLLAKWKDETPLNNTQSSKGGHGFAGDCLQVRFITGYETPAERVSHWMGWRDRDGISVLSAAYNRDFKGPALDNALNDGAQQAFHVDEDGDGYTQEIAIPWKLLTKDGQPLKAGDTVRMALEPNFTMTGLWGRLNIHDIFRQGVAPDRVFTFRAYAQWGEGILEKSGHVSPAQVRLSDAREFPVKQATPDSAATPPETEPVWLAADWKGLIVKRELPGFKTLTFSNPADGDVSLNIFNSSGDTVRQLLTEASYDKGTHDVKWDGLTTPRYKTPGDPVPAGTYTWAGLSHPPFKLTLRGWAYTAGSTPWNNGPTTGWGGDHGLPDAIATDGEKMFIGWSEAEAGKGLLATDFDGNIVWKVGSGLAGSDEHLAVDQGTLFSIGRGDLYPRHEIVRLRTKDGVFDNWEGQTSAALDIPQIWGDKPDLASWPQTAEGLEVKDGKMALTFSSQSFYPVQISDMKGFVTKLISGDPVDQRIMDAIDPRMMPELKRFADGKLDEKRLGSGRNNFAVATAKALTGLLDATDLAPGTASMPEAARAEANRKFLEKNFAGSIAPLKTNFIAVCDAHSGKLLKTWPLPYPEAVHAMGTGKLAFISGGSSLVTLDPGTGATKALITGLDHAANFTTDADGKIYVSVGGADQQVKIFTVEGKPAGAIGKKGGHQLIGPWQPEGMYCPTALAVDKNKHLWVTESDRFPKRVSVWTLPDGKLVTDFFGAAHYGASGGAIDPLDPNVMVGIGCEWKLDPATGRTVLIGIFDRDINGFATFCPASNGKLYVAVLFDVAHFRSGVRIYERLSPGVYIPRAEWRPDIGKQTTTVWSDINGDGKPDPNEITTLPYEIQLHGSNSWSLNMNPADFTLFGGVGSMKGPGSKAAKASAATVSQPASNKVFRINPDGFTACGAPKWKLNAIEDLGYAWNPDLEQGSYGMLPSKDNKLLLTVGRENFTCYDLAKQKPVWTYPNTFFQVGGSHMAPPPIPGLMRGAYGAIGIFNTPQTGTAWVINGNCGEWFILNEKGYYLGHLFQGDVMKMHYPDKAIPGVDMTNAPSGSGGEDFGGSLTQAADGKVYIEAGKTVFWNVELSGLDQVAAIAGGKVEIKPDDIALAQSQRESQLQAATSGKLLNIGHNTVTFTGSLAKDFDRQAVVKYGKGVDAAVQSAAAWDDQMLYLGWEVTDTKPWVNGATDVSQMYVSGDTADFQFGSVPEADVKRGEAAAGDFRLSIGNFQGTPTAELYRAVSDQKKPRDFTSGVVKDYRMDYVAPLPQAQIKVTPLRDNKGYVIEAAIPLTALGFTPRPDAKYRGDFGVTYGDAAGSRTRLRVYWSNQETGLVDDAVFELKMTPRNWGDLIFTK